MSNDNNSIEAISTCYELAGELVSLTKTKEILKERTIRFKRLPVEQKDKIIVPNDFKTYQAEKQFLEAFRQLRMAGGNMNDSIAAVRNLQRAIEESGCPEDPRFVALMEILRENRNA